MKLLFSVFKKIQHFIRKRWKLLILLLVIVGGIFLWRQRQQASHKVELKFTSPQRTKLVKTLEVAGIIDAKEKATLRFASGGKVTYIGAQEGDLVKRWQTLARIDTRDLQKRLQQDLNLYFNERMDFEQGKDDRQDIAPTDALGRTAQKEQKDLENTVLSVEIRDIAIRNSVLSSPIEGILVSTPTTVAGVNLAATDAFEVINPRTLVFRATVDQADVSSIKKGQKVTLTLDAYPDKTIETEVSYIAYKSTQSSNGTVFIVEMLIPNDYQYAELEHYRLGMNGDADIVLDEREHALAIPLDATTQRDNKTFVQVKTGPNTAVEKEIKVGLETEDQVEVIEGLSESDQVVIPK
jgi:RND family efflux transporter MFP subunit